VPAGAAVAAARVAAGGVPISAGLGSTGAAGDDLSPPASPIHPGSSAAAAVAAAAAAAVADTLSGGIVRGGVISIGSLIIRAGSNSVLATIRNTWPDFSALSTSTELNTSGTLPPQGDCF
jgi:hypothetical protein